MKKKNLAFYIKRQSFLFLLEWAGEKLKGNL